MYKECKCKEFFSQTSLGGEIRSADVNTHKGHYDFKASSCAQRKADGGGEKTGLARRHQSLACHTRFVLASVRKTKRLRRRQTLEVV